MWEDNNDNNDIERSMDCRGKLITKWNKMKCGTISCEIKSFSSAKNCVAKKPKTKQNAENPECDWSNHSFMNTTKLFY